MAGYDLPIGEETSKEIFAKKLRHEEGIRVLREGVGMNKPLALEPSLT